MEFTHTVMTSFGVEATHHIIRSITDNYDGSSSVMVESYFDEDAADSGKSPLASNYFSFSEKPQDVQAAILQQPFFLGG